MRSLGNISDIKHYAINDGPGIRVTVFMKGCPLNCAWCHNPESISSQREIMYRANRCILCGECIKACPHQALSVNNNIIACDRKNCALCGKCTQACPTLALQMVGEEIPPAELIKIIEKERVFFEQSGGGVTFSGGEPLMQPIFLREMLQLCRERKIHTVVDTSGYGATEELLEIAAFTDLFLFDLKLVDSSRHMQWTGAEVETIHANLHKLCASGAEIVFRLPLIVGVNSDRENLEKTAQLIASLPGQNHTIDLLPWHNIAQKKYEQLDRECRYAEYFAEPEPQDLSTAVLLFAQHGIKAQVQTA